MGGEHTEQDHRKFLYPSKEAAEMAAMHHGRS